MDCKNALLRSLFGAAFIGSLFVGGVAYAQSSFPQNGGGMSPGIFGTVSAASGSTLTIESRGFGQSSSAVTYTVDASNATVTKNNTSASLSDIVVGDMVMIEGIVTGNAVTATTIHDVILKGMPQGQERAQGTRPSTSTLPVQLQARRPATSSMMMPQGYDTASGTVAAPPTFDQVVVADASTTDKSVPDRGFVNSILDSVGSFFHHLFGFF